MAYTEKTVHSCQSITEVKVLDKDGVEYTSGYDIVDSEGVNCFYPQCLVNSFSGQTDRQSMTSVEKNGAVITSIKQELFCVDEDYCEYVVYTTDAAP